MFANKKDTDEVASEVHDLMDQAEHEDERVSLIEMLLPGRPVYPVDVKTPAPLSLKQSLLTSSSMGIRSPLKQHTYSIPLAPLCGS